jgi:glycerol-3-phosphate dehydrogenase
VLLGTTDTPYEGDPAAVYPDPSDVAALLGDANRFLDLGLGEADVISAFAGLRPLVADEAATTATTSREHAVSVAPSGLVSVSGGKLTTYRRMARDTVDAALRAAPGSWGASATAHIPVQGATDLARKAPAARARARELGLPTAVVTHLIASYGADAPCVLALVAERSDLGRLLVPGLPYLRAEAVYGARREGAQTLEDVLRRRTRVALEDRDGGMTAAPDAANLLAAELGWDAARRERELDAYLRAATVARSAWRAVAGDYRHIHSDGVRQ